MQPEAERSIVQWIVSLVVSDVITGLSSVAISECLLAPGIVLLTLAHGVISFVYGLALLWPQLSQFSLFVCDELLNEIYPHCHPGSGQ